MQLVKSPELLRNFQFVLIYLRNVKAVSNKSSTRTAKQETSRRLLFLFLYFVFISLEIE